MVSKQYKEMLSGKSVIRQLSEFATKRGLEIGYENVFDYSLGNPSVPCPIEFTHTMMDLLKEKSSGELHGYSPSLGNPDFKEAVARNLEKRFKIPYEAEHIFPATGAAGAIAHAVRAVTSPGDEFIIFAPFFPEYRPYLTLAGLNLKICPPDTSQFQIDFEAFETLLSPNVTAILLNSPNNPTGVIYSKETIERLATILREKSIEYGHSIYIISDEPYREIIFSNVENPCISKFYDNTLVCYSFSKSISLPGERIGYIAVNPSAEDAKILCPIFSQISRGIGHNCPPSIIQQAVAKVLDLTSDLAVYEKNMNLIYQTLIDLNFQVVKPDGTFYIFPKAMEENANSFCEKAKAYDLILVPGDSFGCPGYFRMAYCIETEKVERSLLALRKFVETEYPKDSII